MTMFRRKEKLRRKKKEPIHLEKDLFMVSPHGGFMPYPPERCTSPRIQIDLNTNIHYVDFVLCLRTCGDSGYCKRYNEYRNYHKTLSKTERKANH